VTGSWFIHQFRKLPPRARAIALTSLVGLAAGVGAVAFQLAINRVYSGTLLALAGHSLGVFIVGSFAVIVGSAMISGRLMTSYCREAAGSGIPQLKLAYWKDFGLVPWRAVWVKFCAGALAIGGGSSLGREGPSVYLAGGLASNLAGWLGEPKQNRRPATAAGAAAGLAAAFNTPLAAVTFVLEEIIEDLNSRWLGSVLLASVIGALVVHGLVGKQPAFRLGSITSPAWPVYLLTPVVAALAAVAGAAFQKLTLRLRRERAQLVRIPPWLLPSVGALITWLLGISVFAATGLLGVFSLGYDDLSAGINGQLTWKLAAFLLATKLAATVACYGLGGCGGVFSPTLFFGGMCGILIGDLAAGPFHLSAADQTILAVVGMSGCLGAVVRAPVTGILIVFEMTHEFALVPALMLGALVSQAVARRLTSENLYDALLEQDGHHLEHVIPPRDMHSWQLLPVSAVANFQPVSATDLAPDVVRELMRAHPYRRFPVTQDGRVTGVLTREGAEAALSAGQPVKPEAAVTCLPNRTIGELQRLLIDSSMLFVVIVSREGRLVGVVTLHDLLRAELAVAKGSDES